MNAITSILGIPFGWLMWACYYLVGNYGIALFLFTILARAAMIPFTIKQQKSSAKMATIQPKIAELQKKYKSDKNKLSEETMKLYQEEGYNPMSGCMPLLIQFPILFGLIDVIYKPMKHILRLPQDIIELGEQIYLSSLNGAANGNRYIQLEVVKDVMTNPSAYSQMGAEAVEKIQNLNLVFLGMDLTQRPEFSMLTSIFTNFNPIVFIPILSGVSALAMSMFSMRNTVTPEGGAGSMKGMMYMMPIMSMAFAFSVSAGVGLYWFYSNLIGIVQQFFMNKFYNPREMAEKARLEMEERKEQERLERIEAKKKAKELGDGDEKKGLTAKEVNRRKLAEARKRDAEKYGEEYVEVTDKDLA